MKRSLSNPELALPKHHKQSDPLFQMVQMLNDNAILTQILELWLTDRKGTYFGITLCENESSSKRVPYDWLGVQVMTTFYGPNAPWNTKIAMDSVQNWIREAVPERKFLHYTVWSQQQRDWYRCSFTPSLRLLHIFSIVETHQLHMIAPKGCYVSCGGKWQQGCVRRVYTIIQFAMDNMNLPLWRRILDCVKDGWVPVSTVLKEIENRAKQQSSINEKFLAALCDNVVKLPSPIYVVAKHFYRCIFKKGRHLIYKGESADKYFRFCRALSILFEERGLDFNFWQSGNLVFVNTGFANKTKH